MSEEPQALSSILDIENADHNLAHHGTRVCSLAIAIAQQLGIFKTNKAPATLK